MKILNFGSLNIDHVYQVNHFVRPGETMGSDAYHKFCGGKGLNQSIALASAGAQVHHAGRIGSDGQILLDILTKNNVDTTYVVSDNESVSGHAIIQIDSEGQNCIILHGGANQEIRNEDVDNTVVDFTKGDYLLLQNEVNGTEHIIRAAKKRGMKVVFNPAPFDSRVKEYPLDMVDILIVNEVEGYDLTDEKEPEDMIKVMSQLLPGCIIVLTLGSDGSMIYKDGNLFKQAANTSVKVVDTTAAGDTFIGYLIYSLTKEMDVPKALALATKACALCISRNGAASSIPKYSEII